MLINTPIWKLIRSGHYDAVITQTGYSSLTYWILLAAAKLSKTPVIFCTDVSSIRPADPKQWKSFIKPLIARRLFQLNSVIAAGSTSGRKLFREMQIPDEQVVLTPFVVDNEWWIRKAEQVDRRAVRESWNIPDESPVVLFCAKLQHWKRPLDLVEAFAAAAVPGSYLVFAGDGPLRREIEAKAAELGILDRVRLLGFVNQSGLPEVYCAADLLVLPSEYEPFAVVVNEAMLCGCATLVSDRVGAARDLVSPGVTGLIFPYGRLDVFTEKLRNLLSAPAVLKQMGAAARTRMQTWSLNETVEGFIEALTRLSETDGHDRSGRRRNR